MFHLCRLLRICSLPEGLYDSLDPSVPPTGPSLSWFCGHFPSTLSTLLQLEPFFVFEKVILPLLFSLSSCSCLCVLCCTLHFVMMMIITVTHCHLFCYCGQVVLRGPRRCVLLSFVFCVYLLILRSLHFSFSVSRLFAPFSLSSIHALCLYIYVRVCLVSSLFFSFFFPLMMVLLLRQGSRNALFRSVCGWEASRCCSFIFRLFFCMN